MSVELEIGKNLNFYVYSEMGKAVVEGKVKSLSGEYIEFEVDTERYPALNNVIKTHRNNLVD